MTTADELPNGQPWDSVSLLRHDLKTPLVSIHGRAQLLARSVQRSPTLSEEERVRMLSGLTSIAVAVQEMVTLIDGIGGEDWPR